MTRKWAATGIVDYHPYQLDDEILGHLKEEINYRGLKNVQDDFYSDISEAISFYLSSRKLHEQCKPALMRKNLKEALNLSVKLEAKIAEMDSNSTFLVYDAIEGGCETLNEYLYKIMSALSDAKLEADEYPSRGSLPDSSKVFLAKSVAVAIEKHLLQPATTTKEGLFESVLSIILSSIRGKGVSSVHDLCRKTLNVYSTATPGAPNRGEIKYTPPKDE